jgi:hypothetical protein
MNAEKIKAVQWFMPVTRNVNELAYGRHIFIGGHRRLSAANRFF